MRQPDRDARGLLLGDGPPSRRRTQGRHSPFLDALRLGLHMLVRKTLGLEWLRFGLRLRFELRRFQPLPLLR